MTASDVPVKRSGAGPRRVAAPPGRRLNRAGTRRLAALAGLLAAAAYLAGTLASGALDPWARRPLLDGLAPRAPYRWVKPPPELAASNKPPSSGHFEAKLTGSGSQVGAFSTQDTQVTLILGQAAFKASAGQAKVAVDVAPVDPATLAGPPEGMLVAGNAYRVQASYLPGKQPIGTVDGELNLGLVYPLLSAPVADPAGHVVLTSRDGHAWRQLPSVDVPGTHQVNAQLSEPGYVMAAVPAGSAGGTTSLSDRLTRQGPLVAGALLLVLAVVLFLRRRSAYERLEAEAAGGEEDGAGAERDEPAGEAGSGEGGDAQGEEDDGGDVGAADGGDGGDAPDGEGGAAEGGDGQAGR